MNIDIVEQQFSPLRSLYRADETDVLSRLLPGARFTPSEQEAVKSCAAVLMGGLRDAALRGDLLERFQHEYQLSSREGVALMRLAEALLRIPDSSTAYALVRDNISDSDWGSHRGHSASSLVNVATFSLEKFSNILNAAIDQPNGLSAAIAKMGTPVAKHVLQLSLSLMGQRYVFAETIDVAVKRAARSNTYSHSFDMLGESARTAADARRYFDSYAEAIESVGKWRSQTPLPSTISIKLSALHPRYEVSQERRVETELLNRLIELLRLAKSVQVPICVDAEEADRLELSLRLFRKLAKDPAAAGWEGLGLAVQGYQKRASAVIGWLEELGEQVNSRFAVRLVKGAYWDAEIKRCQERGLTDYPVFTRKAATDVSYLSCARQMLQSDHIYPAFATHNARTVASIVQLAGRRRTFEFQRLQGMGDGLYETLWETDPSYNCRLYAPVGPQKELLSYLVRRLLENGANTSFLKQAIEGNEAEALADPVAQVESLKLTRHPAIPLPINLFGPKRSNSMGVDLSDVQTISDLNVGFDRYWRAGWKAHSLVAGRRREGAVVEVKDPANNTRIVGAASLASMNDVASALSEAERGFGGWSNVPVGERARCLNKMADLIEKNRIELMALCIREAGKTIPDALAEIREAVDFCRYYAACAEKEFQAISLPGPTGERNELSLAGRGLFVCISPWNFPLAIFTGQVAAAVVAGNAVIAKPAPQTPLIAFRAVQLFHEAGVPANALQLLLGGADIGRHLVDSPLTSGVAFTGSTEAARHIQTSLISRPNSAITPFIAETGGINVMIADSSALAEQLVADVITSGFQSAGQRCSALRLLYLQEDTADYVIDMLIGAMDELTIGDPADIATDVGPVIDAAARDRLSHHVNTGKYPVIHKRSLEERHAAGTFFAPHLLRVAETELDREVFGPVVHVKRWKSGSLEAVFDDVNRSGYGLTLGLHSRISANVEVAKRKARVGNLYVNRSMIGAVVGSQPFGGEGLSGTGPKAGGPRYLSRFATERALSVDTTAAGGNAALMAGFDDTAV
ncbi:MAG: bifunctional proline dehydrogenase/L-glutamate gamma-semialdehyde dehydrogenase PutA [Rhodospirillaceae bacterium]